MPTAHELFTAGRLDDAIGQLGAELRDAPTDRQRRTFLFELLLFAGQYDRAEKQLDVLAKAGADAEAGTLIYRSAIHGERERDSMFQDALLPPMTAPSPLGGTLNGKPFTTIADADSRIGERLEVFAGGRYLWIPWSYVAALSITPPTRLRDLRWLPARITTGPAARDMELGDVLLPALTSGAWRHGDDNVRLGREADWEDLTSGEYVPVGLKVLRIDDELIPLANIREISIIPPADEQGT